MPPGAIAFTRVPFPGPTRQAFGQSNGSLGGTGKNRHLFVRRVQGISPSEVNDASGLFLFYYPPANLSV